MITHTPIHPSFAFLENDEGGDIRKKLKDAYLGR